MRATGGHPSSMPRPPVCRQAVTAYQIPAVLVPIPVRQVLRVGQFRAPTTLVAPDQTPVSQTHAATPSTVLALHWASIVQVPIWGTHSRVTELTAVAARVPPLISVIIAYLRLAAQVLTLAYQVLRVGPHQAPTARVVPDPILAYLIHVAQPGTRTPLTTTGDFQ